MEFRRIEGGWVAVHNDRPYRSICVCFDAASGLNTVALPHAEGSTCDLLGCIECRGRSLYASEKGLVIDATEGIRLQFPLGAVERLR
jgi:hypothetical protein